MQIKFLEAREIEDGEGVVYARFKAGHVYELSTASARHWISRGAAVVFSGRPKPEKSPAAKPAAKPDDGCVNPTFPKSGKGKRRSYSRRARV